MNVEPEVGPQLQDPVILARSFAVRPETLSNAAATYSSNGPSLAASYAPLLTTYSTSA